MRIDKLTTAFQQALAEAQSLAVARDNPYIEPAHLLAAMLAQPDGPKALLDRAGANTAALKTALDTEGPVVLDVLVSKEENCYPMIPAGQAARDMVG